MTGSLTSFHGKVHTQVNILCPDIIGRLGVEHGVDTTVQVGLAGGLATAGHGNDGGTGPVPGQHVSGPADNKYKLHSETDV